jgi:hypothetical protein
MMNFTELPPVPSDRLVPATDQLRLAVAVYLARFKGSSREHTASDLRCYLVWCTERGLDPLAARRASGVVSAMDAGDSPVAQLSDRDFGRVDFLVGLLAEHVGDPGEPYTRHLGGKVRVLRFHLLRQQTRVTYPP